VTASTPVWGRMRRGRVWHVCAPGDEFLTGAWCGEHEPITERVPNTPPDGARPCPNCLAAVARYADAVATQRQAPLVDPVGGGQR
jgi:hypothetical protein